MAKENSTCSAPEPIAMVGSGCRFPGGANSPSSLWDMLKSPPDLRREISGDRFNPAGFYHPDGTRIGRSNVRHSYLLDEDVRRFDAPFFNISANEAEAIDPQQRILLETVYQALEAGGHTLESLRGSDTSVYVGTMTLDYHDILVRDHNTIPKYFATGINRAVISNRVSYFFDWHGPSMTIDTACSSSLIAVHQAIQSLRSGESQVAVACGTQVLLSYDMYIGESNLKMLSPNGRSRMWDADADGYARGEGVAAIVMKRLSDAIADGDHVECIIRETGANQDGFSNGLTVPSSEAQAKLIRQTYAKISLDPEGNPADRPQYFEAHGTGTQAGDPREAEAIYNIFGKSAGSTSTRDAPLYVGSIKTIIGHLEGAAGVAGLLKASLCLQNGMIPPNLSFARLNPKIEPFYKNLEVPTHLRPWPRQPYGVPRRASVNSFGFGGANAHAILEQHVAPLPETASNMAGANMLPFVFSALTESSLVSALKQYSQVLKERAGELHLGDLAWTLACRRSQMATKISFSASTAEQLVHKIEKKIALGEATPGTALGHRSRGKGATLNVLGVFTGQGAQWPAMGAHLIRSCSRVSEIIDHLQAALESLPPADRPTWHLREQMLAGADRSRIAEAAISQPLCTAVQIILVDLLCTAGITFSAVVGHSSGEIGAAYAAGMLSAADAIRIAYYRGLYAHMAGNSANSQKGGMMAAGLSLEEAEELVNSIHFKGRLAIAAHNSSASVTLSGDLDAITEAKKHLDEKKAFARLLKVDTAYHSHHMLPCGEAYVSALDACHVRVGEPHSTSKWYSSVTPKVRPMMPCENLQSLYWRDNMTSAVLFSDAVKNAIADNENLELVIEVGPHPALKGPVTQNVADVRASPLPYTGVLSRGVNDAEAFAESLGFIWTMFGNKAVDLESFRKATMGEAQAPPKLVVGLPTYQWDHDRIYWTESRRSRKMRGQTEFPHELLGTLSPESNSRDIRWSNILRTSSIPWMAGHKLQGLTVFPAAGYVAMAMEAGRKMAGSRSVRLYELRNLLIPKAITFDDEDVAGVETLVTLSNIHDIDGEKLRADFSLYSAPVVSSGQDHEMELIASATLIITLGNADPAVLSSDAVNDYNMNDVDADRTYNSFSKLGYGYTGAFRGLSSIKRRLNHASAHINRYEPKDAHEPVYFVHPSTLDVAIQSAMVAYSCPGDERLWNLHVPTGIGSIRVNPAACEAVSAGISTLPIYTTLDQDTDDFSANITIYDEGSRNAMVELEQLLLSPFAPATAAEDRSIFSSTRLGLASPDAGAVSKHRAAQPSAEESALTAACERIAYYYLRQWMANITAEDWAKSGSQQLMQVRDFAASAVSRVSSGNGSGNHGALRREWFADTATDIANVVAQYADDATVRLLSAVGESMPAAIQDGKPVSEYIEPDNLVGDYFKHGLGIKERLPIVAGVLEQITYRYPHAKILEIGSPSNNALCAAADVISAHGGVLASYTYTHPSQHVVEQAMTVAKNEDKISFKTLDIHQEPTSQGFQVQSFDVIIACESLRTSSAMHETLQHVRQLLRPGGYLILLEATDPEPIRHATIMASLSYLPTTLTSIEWHTELRKAGFGGVDSIVSKTGNAAMTWPFSVMVAQAVVDEVKFLREPLAVTNAASVFVDNIVVLGNGSLESCRLAEQVTEKLGPFCGNVTTLPGLPTAAEAKKLQEGSTFINLVDIDAPVLQGMTAARMGSLKRILELARHVLWVTNGAISGTHPYHAASLAFLRSISHEAAHVSIAALDVAECNDSASQVVAEQLLRQCALEEWNNVDLLWSKEPESFLRGDKLMLPRILPDVAQNARLNATRRAISKVVSATSSKLAIVANKTTSAPCLVESINLPPSGKENGLVSIAASSLMAIRVTPDAKLYVGVGQSQKTEAAVVALSTINSKTVDPVASIAVPPMKDSSKLAGAITNELLTKSIFGSLPPKSRLLVHFSSQHSTFASVLCRRAADQGVTASFSHADTSNVNYGWISFRPHESKQAIKRKLFPLRPTHYLDMSQASDMGRNIDHALSAAVKRLQISDFAGCESSISSFFDDKAALSSALENVLQSAGPSLFNTDDETNVVSIDKIQDASFKYSSTDIVAWSAEGNLVVPVCPLDGQQMLSPSKTYILFGLAGQIGQSLCEWMVCNGAGCVILVSRSPKVDSAWLDSFQGTESSVKVMAADITDIYSLEAVVTVIKETCLPIGGIVNGANSLSDAPFSSMSAELMNRALRPKIDGSLNLDRVFYRDKLDFFIMLSSISCVIGTAGQSNYAAANGFMNGLAKHRRSRGLAASALDLGLIMGIGVAEAAGQHIADSLQKYGITPLSESDVRLAFAESILGGYAAAGEEDMHAVPRAVITSGIRTITAEETGITWYNDPIFSHLLIDSSDGDNNQIADKASKLTVKEEIANAATNQEVLSLLKEALSAKLRLMLQSPDLTIVHDAPLVELGIDSLVAVEVRSWFLKTLKVDVPVLKLVGGSSLEEVCELAIKKLPDELLSHVGQGESASEPATAAPRAPPPKAAEPVLLPAPEAQMQHSKTPSSRGRSTTWENSSPGAQTPSSKETNVSSAPSVADPVMTKAEAMLEHSDDESASMNGSNAVVKTEPISVGQSRFWFLQYLVDDPTTFNVALCFRITGTVRVVKLENAFWVLTERHESLRTSFVGDADDADQATQKVLATSLFKLERASAESVDQVRQLYTKLRSHVFNLSEGPLLRVMLVTLSTNSHYLLVNYHHIIMDMASFQVLTSDLDRVYSGRPLGPPPSQYPAFSIAQHDAIANGKFNDDLEYWKGVFPIGEQPPVLSLLPMARSTSRSAMTDYAVHQIGIRLDAVIAARVRTLAKTHRSTPFHFYLAAFKSMLFSLVEDEDITIGIADANRHDSDTINSIGFFLNLLALRFKRTPSQPFVAAIAEARDVAYAALDHSRLPFDVLLKELNVARSSTYSPFFQAFFDYRQQTSDKQTWLGCRFDLEEMHPGRTAYDISLDVADLGSEVHVNFRAQQGLYDMTATNLLLETYTHFVDVLSQDIELTVESTPRFSMKQLARAVQVGVGPDMTSGWPSTLPHRIDQIASQFPDNIALMDGMGNSLTYATMIQRVEAIAEALVKEHIVTGSRVLVYQQAVADWICSLLAIMRIGGVYVPLDIRNPIERLAAQADHCRPAAVLVDTTTAKDAAQLHSPVVLDVATIPAVPTTSVPNSANPDTLAAILYTSGSTGKPKGIMVKHSGIRNEIEGYTKTYKLGAERILQQSAFTFDFSMDQIFTGLSNAGMLYIVPWSKRGDPISITEIMNEQHITYTKVTPSEYGMWIRYGGDNLRHATNWRFAFAGGEPLTSTVLGQFDSLKLSGLELYNSYGPAEISIASHKGLVDYHAQNCANGETKRVACGYSLPNYATYVMDKNQNPLPPGMPGEVVIGGPGVSAGYLANQELTSRAFLPNPHTTPRQRANGWTMMHRTGDIGHLAEDGALVFHHRIHDDAQIKLRGLRIDLGDVESSIVATAAGTLKAAVVTLREGDPNFLVAHVVFVSEHKVADEASYLKSLLSRLPLPQYMVPVIAVALSELPLSSHSKVDRKAIKALPLPAAVRSADKGVIEMTETMAQLARLWRDALPNVDALGLAVTPETSFFAIGGNSLLIVRLQSKLREAFNVAVRLVDLLNANTLEKMARAVEECPALSDVDWEAETAPPTVPKFLETIDNKSGAVEKKVVLVTGATGSVAKQVLPRLVADERVGEIHCIVRKSAREVAHLKSRKIVQHVGDLALPLLGLAEDEFHDLAQRAHVIMHMCAVRSFWDNYHILRAVNVQSTKELIAMASPRRIPIHFISTSSLLPRDVLDANTATSAAPYTPPVDGTNGYAASKWASERVLERAAQGPLAVPSFIHRLFPSVGSVVEPKKLVLEEFVRCIDETGFVPITTGWEGRMDLIPGQLVSTRLCNSALAADTTASPAAAHWLHYESTVSLDVKELAAHVKKERGDRTLSEIPILQWFGKIKAAGLTYILASHDAALASAGGDLALATRR